MVEQNNIVDIEGQNEELSNSIHSADSDEFDLEDDDNCMESENVDDDHIDVDTGSKEFVFSNKYFNDDGSPYWIPQTDEDITPKINDKFNSYNEAVLMYKNYALHAGFDVRLGSNKKKTDNTFSTRYLLCNREGKPNTGNLNTIDIQYNKIKRRKDLHRRECKAHIVFKLIPGTEKYYVHNFIESHNHELICKANMHLSRSNRQLDFTQQTYVYNMSKQNVGATRAHRLMSGIQGGYDARGGQVVDYKNYMRDLNYFIGGSDAQLVVKMMEDRVKYAPNFSFEFRVEEQQLNAMFWADETAKFNYKEFGDVVSFDATFNTNRYNMVFVPFTGIDNHKKCVTFGAGLLSREDTDSYVWLLTCFLNAFGRQPVIVMSDQDPAMKKAIKQVFPISNHRLCMWHITTKLPMKIPFEILNKTDFRKRFNSLVWNSKLDEVEFEAGWELMIDEFNLADNKWLREMYALRNFWIPAYFKDVPMSGLMRTTSLSESQNWSFQNTTLTSSYLINFMTTFDSAMERQRYYQNAADFATNSTYPRILSYLPYEPHADKVYTRKVFYQVQEEIFESEKSCLVMNFNSTQSIEKYVVLEKYNTVTTRKNKEVRDEVEDSKFHYNTLCKDTEFKVTHDGNEALLSCTCMHFEHVGLLCRHVFCVMKYCGYEKIPERYILRRWCRDIIPPELLRRRFKNHQVDGNVDKIAIDIFSTVDYSVNFLSRDHVKLQEFYEEVSRLKSKFCDSSSYEGDVSKKVQFQRMLGVTIPNEIEIQNPSNIRNKGCGSRGKRLKNKGEMLSKLAEKRKRMCNTCKQMCNHDKRNCPQKPK